MSLEMTRASMRRSILSGAVVAGLLAFGVGGWAATAELAGAVIAPGLLVVESDVKKVQHPTGGVVGELRVRDGYRVKAGDVLVRLDDTQTRAALGIVTKALDELAARRARNEAERDDAGTIQFPAELLARTDDPDVAKLVHGEERLFEARRSARFGKARQLRERIGQLLEQVQGLADQLTAKRKEIELIGQELKGVRELWQKNLIQMGRVTALERDAARLEGERGALVSTIAQTRGRVTETELQIDQIDQDLKSEVSRDLAEMRAKMSELGEKKIGIVDQLKRVEIRAPQDGVVHQSTIHTVGEAIMLIVPEADVLALEARIAPQDIDQVRLGQRAILRFTAFNRRTTPEINGEVSRISADVSQEQRTGAAFYTIRVKIPESELERLNGLRLVPGMPVESFIQTGERTVLSYLLKPLSDQFTKAWREK